MEPSNTELLARYLLSDVGHSVYDGPGWNDARRVFRAYLDMASRLDARAAPRMDAGATVKGLGRFANWVQHREGCRELMQQQMSENLPPTCSCGLDREIARSTHP